MKRFAVKMTITNNKGLTRISALTNYLKETENFFRHNCKILKNVVYPGEIYLVLFKMLMSIMLDFDLQEGFLLCFLWRIVWPHF